MSVASLTTISVDRAARLGEVSPLVYGQFTEHLAHVVYGGIWSEMAFGRKFETPMVRRLGHEIAAPWQPFGGGQPGVSFTRAPVPIPRFASPQAGAHHTQGVVVGPGFRGGEVGLIQPDICIDSGVTYNFRARVRRIGPAAALRVALRGASVEEVLAEAEVDIPEHTPSGSVPLWMEPFGWHEVSCELRASASDPTGHLSLTVEAAAGREAIVWFDWVSLMPADALDGIEPRVVDALRDLPVRLLKWPGGCMADNYDWRWGIGPRDGRYAFMDYAWLSWDENDFGTDEFIRLCRLTNAEPNLCVNAGSGSPELAAAWVEYCNGPADSEWGARRAAGGNVEPFNVRYWCVGNEQWGFFERGFAGPDDYARRYLEIAQAMRAVDPSITLIAVGQPGEFNQTVLRMAGDLIDQLSIHWYDASDDADSGISPADKIGSATRMDGVLQQVAQDIASAGTPHVTVALDEWGWSREHHAGALLAAGVLNAIHRNAPLVSLGAKSCAINVDGLIKREGVSVTRVPVYEVFSLYNRAFQPWAVSCSVDDAPGHIDVSALTSEAGATSVFAINRGDQPQRARLLVDGASVDGGSRATYLVADGAGPYGHSAPAVSAEITGGELELPAYSLTIVECGGPAR